MKKLMIAGLITGLVLGIVAGPLYAEIPKVMQYQGKLTDVSGNPLNGAHKLIFRLYDAESAGIQNSIWSETHTSVEFKNGIFSVLLGIITPLDLPFDKDYWLGIQVDSDTVELSPRQRLASVGYAYRAAFADRLSGSILIPYYISGLELAWTTTSAVSIMPGAIDIAGAMHTTSGMTVLTSTLDSNWLSGTASANGWAYVYAGQQDGNLVYKFHTSAPQYSDADVATSGYAPKRYIQYNNRFYRCIGAVLLDAGIVEFYQRGDTIWYEDERMFALGGSTNDAFLERPMTSVCPPVITYEAQIQVMTEGGFVAIRPAFATLANNQGTVSCPNRTWRYTAGWFAMPEIPAIDYLSGANTTGYVSAYKINVR